MNLSSSPGWPFTRKEEGHPAFGDKRKMFAYGDGVWARSSFQSYVDKISSVDYKCSEVYTLSPKAEMRKKKKIESDQFRAFTAASWRNTAAGIAMCGDMAQKFYDSWQFSAAFVGGTTFHGGWNKLFTRLHKHPNAFECDESFWDATLQPIFIDSLRDIMWSFLDGESQTKENKIRWDNLFAEIVRSVLICPNGDLFFKFKGNPSGSFLTIVTNTMVLYMIFCYAWIVLAPKEMRDYASFLRHVELALCGDDNLYTVSDVAKGFFNLEAIVSVWQSLGVIAKAEAMAQGPLKDRQFLSQKTVVIHGMYLPYPDYDKTVSSMLWHTHANHHVRWSFLKASALRLSTFWNFELRALFAEYTAWLQRAYSNELRSPQNKSDPMDMFSFEDVMSVYKSDNEIRSLYLISEGRAVSKQAPLKVNLKFLDSNCLHPECQN